MAKEKTKQELKDEIKNFVIQDWDDRNLPVLLDMAFLCGQATAYSPTEVAKVIDGVEEVESELFRKVALQHFHRCEAKIDKLIAENEILFGIKLSK